MDSNQISVFKHTQCFICFVRKLLGVFFHRLQKRFPIALEIGVVVTKLGMDKLLISFTNFA